MQGDLLCELGLAHTRSTEEEENEGTLGVHPTVLSKVYCVCNGPYWAFLTNDLAVKILLESEEGCKVVRRVFRQYRCIDNCTDGSQLSGLGFGTASRLFSPFSSST